MKVEAVMICTGKLAGNRENWLDGLGDTGRHTGNNHVDDDRKEGGEESSEAVLGEAILGGLHNLGDNPANEVHPGHRRGERETGNHGVEGLCFELGSDDRGGIEGSVNNTRPCKLL